MRPLNILYTLLLATALPLQLAANNIQVANATFTDAIGIAQIQFDLSWENSWRGGNWDAAWVFVKYRTSLTGPWLHAKLNNTGHVAAPGSQIELGMLNGYSYTGIGGYYPYSDPVVGVYIYRNANGNGNLNLPGTQLQWNYGEWGINYNSIVQMQVFAIEMVYVPKGRFAVGSGGTETNAFTLTTIATLDPTIAPQNTGSLGGQSGGYPTGQTPPSEFWPNGYRAFYCMKYEVSQQQYVDFLNTLTYTQQVSRTATAPNSAAGTGALVSTNELRNGIDIMIPGVASTTPAVYACNGNGNSVYGEANDGKEIACNYLSWGDLAAYLDWSCLRPMSELEYEKACRGSIAPMTNEYPWGTIGVAGSSYTLANAGAANEGISTNYSTTSGNASYSTTGNVIGGPLRVGIFAANGSNSGRQSAGASYYGIMELGGNLSERTVTIGNVNGRAFTGVLGNGVLLANGDAYEPWPEPGTADGAGFRGGSWNSPASHLQVSDRTNANSASSTRGITDGGRGVRSCY